MTRFYSIYSTTITNMVIIYKTFHRQVLNNSIIKHLILRLEVHSKADQEHRKMFWRVNKSSSKTKCLSICFLPLGILLSAPTSSCSRICSLRCWYILESQNLRVPYLAASSHPQFPGVTESTEYIPKIHLRGYLDLKDRCLPCSSGSHHSLCVEEVQRAHTAFSVNCRGHTATHLDWPSHHQQSLSQTRASARMVTMPNILEFWRLLWRRAGCPRQLQRASVGGTWNHSKQGWARQWGHHVSVCRSKQCSWLPVTQLTNRADRKTRNE